MFPTPVALCYVVRLDGEWVPLPVSVQAGVGAI